MAPGYHGVITECTAEGTLAVKPLGQQLNVSTAELHSWDYNIWLCFFLFFLKKQTAVRSPVLLFNSWFSAP